MNDFDKLLRNVSEENSSIEELDSLKVWLFRENVRLQAERKEIDEVYSRFDVEKKQFQAEMKLLNKRIQTQRQRLQQDELFFDKKRAILENGFKQLDIDRRKLELDKQILENNRKYIENQGYGAISYNGTVKNFFNGVNSTLALKKRYKDLMKIFHPDNVSGDKGTVQLINDEYTNLKKYFARK